MQRPGAHINYRQLGREAASVIELYLRTTLGYPIGWSAAKDQAHHIYNGSRLAAARLLASVAKFPATFQCSATQPNL